VVECLPSKHEVLNSKPQYCQKKKKLSLKQIIELEQLKREQSRKGEEMKT
jgi:hypothetical protein